MVNQNGIEAFLAVCRCKSISRAAEELFLSQSSLSVRIKSLENELGTALFLRKKGQREATLTATGKEFYEIALAYEKLMSRIEKLRRENHDKLRVSSLNSLGAYILPESYALFMEKYPQTGLVIQNYEFGEACKSILRGNTDLAFNTDNSVTDRITATPVFSEGFSLICSGKSTYPETVSADMLSVKNEIYVDWYREFDAYHASIFGDEPPQLCLDMMSQLKIFVEKPNNWAIVPTSVARGLVQNADIRILNAAFALPERTVYCLHSAEEELNTYGRMFLQCLRDILEERKEVVCLLDI